MDLFEFFHMQTSSQTSTIVENGLPFPLYSFGFLSKIMSSQICIFYHYCSVVQLEIRDGGYSRISLIVHVFVLIYAEFLFFCMKLRIVLSRCVKNCVGILMRRTLNLYIVLGKMALFTVNRPLECAWEIFPSSHNFVNIFPSETCHSCHTVFSLTQTFVKVFYIICVKGFVSIIFFLTQI